MGHTTIEGVQLTPLKIIDTPLGAVYHALQPGAPGFAGFGEAYFSTVHYKAVKGWKKHTRMVLNLVVPVGEVKFVIYDDRDNSPSCGMIQEVQLSVKNYQRLTVPAGVWMAFQGLSPEQNLLLNLASIAHDPGEALSLPIDTKQIPYEGW